MTTAMALGIGIGLLYFGGLWLTARSVIRRQRRSFLVVASLFARLSIVGLGVIALEAGGIGQILAALAGIWLVRWYLVAKLGAVGHGRGG